MINHQNPITEAWSNALIMTGAALAAHGVVSALTVHGSPPTLLSAIVATLSFVSAWLLGVRHIGKKICLISSNIKLVLISLAFTAAGTLLGAWVISIVVGNSKKFYCAPAIPWRIEIAIFGSFVIGLITHMAHARRRLVLAYPLILIALLWIAPYYGYFSSPIFLAISLINDSCDRSIFQIALVTLSLLVGEFIGSNLATWIKAASDGPDA